jgi:hypothetical protein
MGGGDREDNEKQDEEEQEEGENETERKRDMNGKGKHYTVYTDTQAGTCGCEARQGREGRGEAWEREGGYDTRNEAQLYCISVLRFVSFILPLRFAEAFIFPLSLLLPLPLPLLD